MRTAVLVLGLMTLAVGCAQDAGNGCPAPVSPGSSFAGIPDPVVLDVELAPMAGACDGGVLEDACDVRLLFQEAACGFVVTIACPTYRGAASVSWDGHQGDGWVDFEGACGARYSVRVADGDHAAPPDGDPSNNRYITTAE